MNNIAHIARRRPFVILTLSIIVVFTLLSCFVWSGFWYFLGVLMIPILVGYYDYFQRSHTLMRNFPLWGRFRWLFEELRPKMYQYFIESDWDGRPINRIDRSTVYQRSKKEMDSIPFGTEHDVYKTGYEWIMHSISPIHFDTMSHDPRIVVGNKDCTQQYSCSIMNISAMSFGALSSHAVEALNAGAKIGGFAHNTGEGGISPYHLKYGGDLIWQIGTGYFGTRDKDGNFDIEKFKINATLPQVKMIEVKLSQGAKPGHGGILPAVKNSEEIARIRHVEPHTTIFSPPYHTAFDTPKGLIQFIQKLRETCGGKPVGFKLCVGKRSEFIAICKAMIELDTYPDFITVDGGEGGTGAAPQEFSNYVGAPFLDALAFVDNILTGFNIRQHIKIIGSGKILNGFSIIRAMALGADAVNSARGMMLALGCIQSLLCNTNRCPTGITTQNPELVAGLDVATKKVRVANFHQETIKAYMELLGATGLENSDQVHRDLIYRRTSPYQSKDFEEIFPSLEPGCLLRGVIPEKYRGEFNKANPNSWQPNLN